MDNAKALFPRHDCGLYLTHNEHIDSYRTVQQEYESLPACTDFEECWVDEEQKRKALEAQDVWCLQWYPDTPGGSYTLLAHDLDVLLARAREVQAAADDPRNWGAK